MIVVTSDEDRRQFGHLLDRAAGPGAGYARYAAAMYFYWRGMIGAATLEVYRVCSKIDHEDPRHSLRSLGLYPEIGECVPQQSKGRTAGP